MSYYPWPKEQFELYVKAMPQSEAQAALIYFMNFMAEMYAAREQVATNGELTPFKGNKSPLETTYPDNTCDLTPLGEALMGRICPECES